MRPLVPIVAFVTVAGLAGTLASLEPDTETAKNHPFLADPAPCVACHPGQSAVPIPENRGLACSRSCRTCHDKLDAHHPTGARREGETEAGLVLGQAGTVECFTCHDLREPRWGAEPRRSQSLFDRLFRRADRHLTYYLPVSNREGALCRACH